MKFWRRRQVVHSVTDARPSLSEDISRREKRYLIQMGIRLVCLVLAVVVPAPWPVRGLFIAGAVFLPYIAVIGANQPDRGAISTEGVPDADRNEIPRHRREIGS